MFPYDDVIISTTRTSLGLQVNVVVFIMMTSSNGNIFRVTGPLCGEFPVNSPHKGQWRGALMFSLICVWINDWVNNREADDLRRHRGHYDVNVMIETFGMLAPRPKLDGTYQSGQVTVTWKRLPHNWLFVGESSGHCHVDSPHIGPITGPLWGNHPHKGPVMWSFLINFTINMKNLLNKQFILPVIWEAMTHMSLAVTHP